MGNDPRECKLSNGMTVYYCSKCGHGKGAWNDSHKEADHKNGWLSTQKDAATQATLTLTDVVATWND